VFITHLIESIEAMAKKRKLNIGSRRLKESSQGTSATHTASAHAQGSNVEEMHPNPSHVEAVTHESEDSYSIPSDIEAEEELEINKGLNYI
jgi:hypothetical protein